jgi:hypothetical protein
MRASLPLNLPPGLDPGIHAFSNIFVAPPAEGKNRPVGLIAHYSEFAPEGDISVES